MDFQSLFAQLDWRSVLDIFLVTVLVYQLLAMLKGTRAAQILIGLVFIFVLYALSSLMQLETINWIVSKVYSSIIIVMIVLFQDDIRRLLMRMGSGPFTSKLEGESGLRLIEEVVSAAKSLSHDRLGGIVVFERGVNLERLHDYGIRVDCLVSEEILICIFQSFSPLHDGAVIIRGGRMSAASTQLPLSKNPDLTKKLGTRHSASLGISEETDAVALVISEETGHISIACDGELYRQASPEAARRMLIQLLLPSQKVTRWKIFLRQLSRGKSIWKLPGAISKGVKRTAHTSEAATRVGAARGSNGERFAKMGDGILVRVPQKQGSVDLQNYTTEGVFVSEKVLGGFMDSDEPRRKSAAVPDPLDDATDEERLYAQNQALRALSQLSAEDRFDPPRVLTTPPRDVSIGGESITPPIDRTTIEAKENKEKELRETRESEVTRKKDTEKDG